MWAWKPAADLNHQRISANVIDSVGLRQFCDAMALRAKSATRLGLSDGPREFQDASCAVCGGESAQGKIWGR